MKKKSQKYFQAASILAATTVGAALGEQTVQAQDIDKELDVNQEHVNSTKVSTDTETIDIISPDDLEEKTAVAIENPYLAYVNQVLVVMPEAPNEFAGRDGFTHVDSSTGFVYEKTNGNWIQKAGLKGKQGDAQVAIHSGEVSPLETEGQNGDSHINTVTGEVSRKILGTWTVISQYQVELEQAKDESEPEDVVKNAAFNKADQKTSQAFPFIPSYSFVRENNHTIANTGIVNIANHPTSGDESVSFVPMAKFSSLLFAGVILR